MKKRVIFNWLIFVVLVTIIAAIAPARIYLIKGKQHFSAGRYQEAIADYQQAIRLNPNFARAYVELGDAKSLLRKRARDS